MNYYRVKPECDQKRRIKNHKRKPDGVFVANELYTAGELDKFYIPFDKLYDYFEHVVIPKNKVYWFFGCRFEMAKEEKNKMKSWKITYTEDKGMSYKTTMTEAETYSKAYINVIMEISKEGIITKVEEIKEIEE